MTVCELHSFPNQTQIEYLEQPDAKFLIDQLTIQHFVGNQYHNGNMQISYFKMSFLSEVKIITFD